MPTGMERRVSRPPSTPNSESGLSIGGHNFTTGPQALACFDRDVTSDFFRFMDKKLSASLQPRLPGSFLSLSCPVLTARSLLPEYYRGRVISGDRSVSRVRPKSHPLATPPPIAPPTQPAPATPGLRESCKPARLRYLPATGVAIQFMVCLRGS